MQHTHYRLTDGRLLRRLMKCPDWDGERHTVRSLSDLAGLSKSKISSMVNDHQTRVTAKQATAIAEAVGVHRKALFTPAVSVFADADAMEGER